jgi:hypothetical protein
MIPFIKLKKPEKNISENVIRIEVFRLLGENVPYSIALFEALQDKDTDNNLVLVNQSNSFKDDVEIVKQKFIIDLQFTLDLSSLSHSEKLDTIKKKIKEQEFLIKSIKDGYIEKKVIKDEKEIIEKLKVNIIDEEFKLTKYNVLLESLENNGDGSYETIDFDGKKRIYYMYKEGVLYPIKYIKAKNTMYPDISTKRKIYKQEQDLIDQEFLNDNKGIFSGWKKYFVIACMIIWMVLLIYWSVQLNKSYAKFDESTLSKLTDMAEGSAIKCAYWYTQDAEKTSRILDNYEKLLNETNISTKKEIQVG